MKEDTITSYIDILEVVVGAIHSIRDKQTGALPEDWAKKVQTTKGDTITTRYQREFPELKQGTASQRTDSTKSSPVSINPIVRFFRNLREM